MGETGIESRKEGGREERIIFIASEALRGGNASYWVDIGAHFNPKNPKFLFILHFFLHPDSQGAVTHHCQNLGLSVRGLSLVLDCPLSACTDSHESLGACALRSQPSTTDGPESISTSAPSSLLETTTFSRVLQLGHSPW